MRASDNKRFKPHAFRGGRHKADRSEISAWLNTLTFPVPATIIFDLLHKQHDEWEAEYGEDGNPFTDEAVRTAQKLLNISIKQRHKIWWWVKADSIIPEAAYTPEVQKLQAEAKAIRDEHKRDLILQILENAVQTCRGGRGFATTFDAFVEGMEEEIEEANAQHLFSHAEVIAYADRTGLPKEDEEPIKPKVVDPFALPEPKKVINPSEPKKNPEAF